MMMMPLKRAVIAAAALILASIVVLPTVAGAQSLSREEVGAALADILQALARRGLTSEEIDGITDEWLVLFGGECVGACVRTLDENLQHTAPARAQQGGPQEALVRHQQISGIYFSPKQRGGLIQRLSVEADPIMVVELSPQRLMTRADVVAAMNLYHFARESGPPQAKDFPEDEIAAAADALQRLYQSDRFVMSRHLSIGAAYWSGLEQGWPRLTEQERALVRAYFADDHKYDPLTADIYTVLLGLTPDQAKEFHLDEMFKGFRDSIIDIKLQEAITIHKINTYSLIWAPNY